MIMKQHLAILFVLLSFIGCTATHQTAKDQTSPEKMALGWLSRDDFMHPDYPRFRENYDSTNVNPDFVEMIKAIKPDVEIIVVLGTWCGDSKRQVSHFLKIVDSAGIPSNQIRYFGVDRSKKSADGVADRHHIDRVPTFIFVHNGAEIGRIVEAPKTTLEEEMFVILAEAAKR